MSKHYGRGGISSRRHGIGGHNGPSPKFKQNRAREANKEIAQNSRRKSKKAGTFYASVSEALKSEKSR